MRLERSSLISVLLMSLLVAIIAGCTGDDGAQGPAGPSGTMPFWTGVIEPISEYETFSTNAGDVNLSVRNVYSVPTVTVNGFALSYDPDDADEAMEFYTDCLPIEAGDSAHLNATYTGAGGDSRTSQAHVVVPGYFWEVGTDEVLMDVNDNPVITWTSSDGTDGYVLYLDSRVHFMDTAGVSRIWGYTLDTVLTDTSFTISGSLLFPPPAFVDYYTDSYYGWINLAAVNGPCREGDASNIVGDGFGFVVGYTDGPEWDISHSGISVTKVSGDAVKKIDTRQRFKDYLSRIFER